jgi:hypothetical protein
MKKEIFRKEALERLGSPEQLDQLMPLTSPRGWLALLCLGLLLVAAGVWGILGRIQTTASGDGLLTRRGGVTMVMVPVSGMVSEVTVGPGDSVEKGQTLVVIDPSESNPLNNGLGTVVSPETGRILDVGADVGDGVEKGQMLLAVESVDVPPEAVVYLSAERGYQVKPGLEVQVVPATGNQSATGSLFGTVRKAGRFPASRASIVRSLQSEDWADTVMQSGPVLEVVVEFEDGRNLEEVYSGTPCSARITIAEQRPIELILPGFDSEGSF